MSDSGRTDGVLTARRVLVLGGARSGKSAYAERLLSGEPEVVYAATAPRYGGDAEWAERLRRHRERRAAHWSTAEVADAPDRLAELLDQPGPPVLADCLTLWLTAAMDRVDAWDEAAWTTGSAPRLLAQHVDRLAEAFTRTARRVVVVTNEIGYGLVPQSPGSRRFRDELGRLNQLFAARADAAVLVAAGLPLVLKEQGRGAG